MYSTDPELLADEVAVKVVDDVRMLVLSHHQDLVDDELFLRLLRQVHLFYGHLSCCRCFDCYVHSA